MSWTAAAVAAAAVLLVAGGLALVVAGRRSAPRRPPPVVVRPSRGALRDAAVVTGVRLAVELARCDGEVHATEMEAVHRFLVEHVKRHDGRWAARMMRAGLEAPRDPQTLRAAMAHLEQMDAARQDLILGLLDAVAAADGVLRDEEREFLARIRTRLGRSE